MSGEDDIVRNRHLHIGVQECLGAADGSGVGPQLHDIELTFRRCGEAHKGFLTRIHDMVGGHDRVDDEVDSDVVEVTRRNLLAPRTSVHVLGNLPDGTEPFAHEEEVSAFPGFARDSGNNGPELLRGGEVGDFLVVRETPVFVTGIKVPQHPRVREWCGIGNGWEGDSDRGSHDCSRYLSYLGIRKSVLDKTDPVSLSLEQSHHPSE